MSPTMSLTSISLIVCAMLYSTPIPAAEASAPPATAPGGPANRYPPTAPTATTSPRQMGRQYLPIKNGIGMAQGGGLE